MIRGSIFYFSLILSLPSCIYSLSLEQRVTEMEKQLSDLTGLVANILEQELVDRYGMIRRCPLPTVDHGEVECSNEDRKPGTTCKALCAPGYIASFKSSTCEKGGQTWSNELR